MISILKFEKDIPILKMLLWKMVLLLLKSRWTSNCFFSLQHLQLFWIPRRCPSNQHFCANIEWRVYFGYSENYNTRPFEICSDLLNCHSRLVFGRPLDLRGNLGNVKEKPTRKTCFFSVKRSAWLHASIMQSFARRHFSDVNEASIVFLWEKDIRTGESI